MGPIAGGFIMQKIGVKWVFIVIASSSDLKFVSSISATHSSFIYLFIYYPVVGSIAAAIGIPILRETYGPVIRQRRAAKSDDSEKAVPDQPAILKERGKLYYLWINLSRPITLLFGSMICFIFSLYMAL